MYLCYGFIFANLFLGILNKHWKRKLERFTESELELLMNYARDETTGLNPNLELLIKKDSLIIIGKPVNRINNLTAIGSYPIVSRLMNNNDTIDNILYQKFVPSDFKMYYSLIQNKKIESWQAIKQYYDWYYPNYIIFAFAPNTPSSYSNYKKDIKIRILFLYVCTYESYSQKGGGIDFIWELFNGKLKERYTIFFGKLKELFYPTYVSAKMKDDPYFLIYQGKYEEAREGLKDLPPVRREFCREKLETLGY